MSDDPVLIVGAGVIGLSIALSLQARGVAVRVIEREAPAAGASAGNAGAFAFSDVFPLASPRIMRKAPRWLLDPLGPLSVSPRYAARLAPWMWQFWRASRPARYRMATLAQTALMDVSREALRPHLQRAGLMDMLRTEGQLEVYEGTRAFRESMAGWQAREALGIAFRHLEGDEIAAIQPGLDPRFTHATFTPGWCSITDPRDYTVALAARVRTNGGEIAITEARALVPGGLETATGILRGPVVIAAGAHSHRLARTAGVRIPLETERGYNTTLPPDAFEGLRTQITFGGHGFVVSRLTSGIRVGGAVELGGLDLPPNFARSAAMLRKAAAFLPGLKTEGGVQWMGFRPSMPDSLAALGPLPGRPDVICAFGHGHLGLTQSAGTAEIVADLITGRPPAIDLSPFAPDRFTRRQ